MESVLVLALKSLLIAGAALLVLRLIRTRSAADRSLAAHLGLGALLLLPLAWLALPQLEVAAPWKDPAPAAAGNSAPLGLASMHAPEADAPATPVPVPVFAEAAPAVTKASINWLFWLYLAPAALLIGLTLVAVLRLALLKSKANVLVESGWLTALARAQRRMGFKNGTALLTSDELRSPISWGLVRPVILLNSEAAEARDEAEAIIAHELAHVANLDWAKLLLARVAVALFWFNPLVWLLAREAHQLREEAADDAVLASDIEDVDYAQLLVGIARHECRGLLIGAHGVAPARNSLARRVKRVLDRATDRASGGWRWTAGAGALAAAVAVPLAALQFVPASPVIAAAPPPIERGTSGAVAAASIAAAAFARAPGAAQATDVPNASVPAAGTDLAALIQRRVQASLPTGPRGQIDPIGPEGAVGPRRSSDDEIERIIEARAVGATPEYIAQIQRAAPHLKLTHDDVISLAALGVTPAYVSAMAAAGYPGLDAETLTDFAAVGVTPGYVAEMKAAGFRSIVADDLVDARAIGITGAYVREMRDVGYGQLDMEQLVELRAVHVTARDVEAYRNTLGRLPTLDQLVELKVLGIPPSDIARLRD